ncbi:rutC family protein UK114-like isoform X3 [Bradysia coprophila]|uniref:rutC family protein UK114-like isoform X3 n=1 Tax=Bradysia coprophila TaxID=38358 RepID=UPI00187D9451|nr:rutC family protein UK114-like isoform X3 [Bradysia coprophila]
MSTIVRKIITTDNAPPTTNPLNRAIVVDRTVYLSGCIGMDKDTMKLAEGGVVPETVQALKNLVAVLEASGSSAEKVVKTTIFVADIGESALINEEYKKVFSKNFPARSCVQVAKLPLNARIEIEAIALVGDIETVYE